MKKFMEEFKTFINRGNVMDLAVGVIIGGAFQSIINSFVNDLIMPILSLLIGGLDFSEYKIVLGTGEDAASINYGNFITVVLNFLIMALVVFTLVKALNKMTEITKKEEKDKEEEKPTTKECPYCKSIISIDATRCPHCTSELK